MSTDTPTQEQATITIDLKRQDRELAHALLYIGMLFRDNFKTDDITVFQASLMQEKASRNPKKFTSWYNDQVVIFKRNQKHLEKAVYGKISNRFNSLSPEEKEEHNDLVNFLWHLIHKAVQVKDKTTLLVMIDLLNEGKLDEAIESAKAAGRETSSAPPIPLPTVEQKDNFIPIDEQ